MATETCGNYELIRPLGRGGTATVYEAKHRYLLNRSMVAVKRFQPRELLSPKEREAWQQVCLEEVRHLDTLDHPHIVPLYDAGIEGDHPYLVMPLAAGTLAERFPLGKLYMVEEVLPYLRPIADALDYAHQRRMIHRDVKPQNILLGSRNELWVSDFGLARIIAYAHTHHTTATYFKGTAYYAAPEQFNPGHASIASDVYAIGSMTYEWVTGERPCTVQEPGIDISIILGTQKHLYPPPLLRSKIPTLSSSLEEIVLLALARDPGARPKSVGSFVSALEESLRIPLEAERSSPFTARSLIYEHMLPDWLQQST